MNMDNTSIDMKMDLLDINSACYTYIDELSFDLMPDNDVRECLRTNNSIDESGIKKYKRVLDNDPTPISELYKAV